jgi:hypothetical protein
MSTITRYRLESGGLALFELVLLQRYQIQDLSLEASLGGELPQSEVDR